MFRLMIDLDQRSDEEELMDDLDCSGEVVFQTLRELDTINKLLGGNSISMKTFKGIARRKTGPIHLIDLGCGSGDLMRIMADWCREKKIDAQFTGVDANPIIIDYAKKHTQNYPEINYACCNVLDEHLKEMKGDIVHTCLFAHHFSTKQLSGLFAAFKSMASEAVIINDLHRHPLAYYAIKWLTKLFSRSYMVQNDACTSVARGFKKHEIREILNAAEITPYQLSWAWAFRWKLVY